MELAHEGTLFLDEVGDMPLTTQAKLLRALEEKIIVRLGGTYPIKIDVRIITATNKNLPELVKKEAFRQDLFYRLNVLMLRLPPLRERREDIPLLAVHFLDRHASAKKLSSAFVQILMAYDWPGNVRELYNAIQSAIVMAMEDNLLPAHLPGYILQSQSQDIPPEPVISNSLPSRNLEDSLREFEKRMLIQALSQCRGIQKQAAELLQIKERSLWHRLKKYEIDAAAFKKFQS
jgi:transcriptional regulator with PAS, ATPase and Fis domain